MNSSDCKVLQCFANVCKALQRIAMSGEVTEPFLIPNASNQNISKSQVEHMEISIDPKQQWVSIIIKIELICLIQIKRNKLYEWNYYQNYNLYHNGK